MKLYYSTAACSLSPHIVLRELGFKFELVPVGLKGGHFKGGDFTKINPKGYVPTLELENGEILTEGAVIIQYLSDQKPEKNLFPKQGSMERYRGMEWLNYISTEIHKGYSPLFSDFPESVKDAAKENLKKRLSLIAKELEKSEYILGAQFSIVDAYLFTVLNWSGFVKLDLSDFPIFEKYMERMKSRPAVNEALKAEGLVR
jgi:glutathione S-transferase